jgi:hypothetical protein
MKNFFKHLVYIIYLTQINYAQGISLGTRVDLTSKLQLASGQFAQLFIPDYFIAPGDGRFNLVFHFHSASWAAEDQVYKSNASALLFNIHLGALSSPYQNFFTSAGKFQLILDTITSVIKTEGIINNPVIDNLILTSFSAGYAGVREILKNSAYYQKIIALTLADGLHSNSDQATMQIQMKDFLQFAKDAAAKKKIMILTHSSITTSGYQSTTQTADYLINGLGVSPLQVNLTDEIGTMYRQVDTGFFFLRGYLGNTASDHLKHLYSMNLMLKQVMQILDSSAVDLNEIYPEEKSFELYQNYPNPFNPSTKIKFTIPQNEKQEMKNVTLRVFDILGNQIALLVNGEKEPDEYETEFNGINYSSGIYFYQLTIGNIQKTKSMLLLK